MSGGFGSFGWLGQYVVVLSRATTQPATLTDGSLLEFSEASYTRLGPSVAASISSASIMTDAYTITWVDTDVMRKVDPGDGYGPTLLCESSASNFFINSDRFNSSSWSLNAGATITTDVAIAPDGTMTADRLFLSSSTNSYLAYTVPFTSINDSGSICVSFWVMSESGSQVTFKINGTNKSSVAWDTGVLTSSLTWQRVTASFPAGSSNTAVPVRFRNDTTTPKNLLIWGANMTQTAWPSSDILCRTGISLTRHSDVVYFNAWQVPYWMRARKTAWILIPSWAASDLNAGDVKTIVSFGGTQDVLRVRHNGTDVRVEALASGSTVAISPALRNNRNDLIWVEPDPQSGVVSLNGYSGSIGTPWIWPSATTRVGGIVGRNGLEFDGRIKEPFGVSP